MVGEELKEDCVQSTVKHGGGGIMVWGCINARGVGILSKVDGRLNGEAYIDMYWEMLLSQPHICWPFPMAGFSSKTMQRVTPHGLLRIGSQKKT